MDAERARRRGLAGVFYALGAFSSWGIVVPLHFKLLGSVPAPLILAQRILWASLMTLGLIAFLRRLGELRKALAPNRNFMLLYFSAFLIAANWLVFIWAVNTGHLVQTSLGYFINPLVSVALGVFVLKERLARHQRVAVGIAAVAVVVLAIDYGRLPWIALTLAFSFGVYGLVKKRAGVDGAQSLAIETALLTPVALAYIVWLEASGDGTMLSQDAGHVALLAASGVVTAVPLILFGVAAIRVTLTSIGILQYLAPTLHFLIGVAVYGEPMPLSRLAGFVLVWVALAIFTAGALRGTRTTRVAAEPALAGAPGP